MSAPASSPPPSSSASTSTGSFQLTPLYGTDSATGGALCSILRLDGCTLLLDLGWDERYDETQLAGLKGIISEIDGVLITHPDLAHLGALPYAIGVLGLNAPVYCTLPVWRNGQMFMYSAWQERWGSSSAADLPPPPFTLDDVDRAFDAMRQLKYSETVALRERGEGIEITPSCAGHMLGGAFWCIKKETESIIYAVDFNHAAERHLNGALLNAPQLHRPSALITDATNVLVTSTKRSQQDATLCNTITERLRQGGCVLMPVDAAGRVLELLLVIHGMWVQQSMNHTYSLIFLSSQSGNTVDFARSQLEWMTEKCRKLFDTHKTNPFALPHLKCISTLEELQSIPKPYCLLASNPTLETSLAQDAFLSLSNDPKNLILFTQTPPNWSLAGQFFDDTAVNSLKRVMPRQVTFQRRRRVRLEGVELEKRLEEQKMKRDQTALESVPDSTEDIEDDDQDMMSLGGGAMLTGTSTDMNKSQKKSSSQLTKQSFPLFPFTETRRHFDIWGEILSAEEVRIISGATATNTAPQTNFTGGGGYNYGRNAKEREQKEEERKKLMEANAARAASAGNGAGNEDQMNDIDLASSEDHPMKTITEPLTIPIACSFAYIDFSGRSDGRSLKTVLKDVSPRKLILISGSQTAKQNLIAYCHELSVCSDIQLPQQHQTISVTSESNLFRVNLKDSYFKSLKFVAVNEEYEIAYVEGEVRMNTNLNTSLSTAAGGLPQLQSAQIQKGHPAVFLGQVRPPDLRILLENAGIQVELVAGTVVVCCDGRVNIHKLNENQIAIRGALCEEYYQIRELLYQQYQIV